MPNAFVSRGAKTVIAGLSSLGALAGAAKADTHWISAYTPAHEFAEYGHYESTNYGTKGAGPEGVGFLTSSSDFPFIYASALTYYVFAEASSLGVGSKVTFPTIYNFANSHVYNSFNAGPY